MQNRNNDVKALLAEAMKALNGQNASSLSPQLNALVNKLSPEDMQKLQTILADKDKMQALVNSPQGKQIMRQIMQQNRKDNP